MTEARLAHEVWQVIKNEDWVLTANTLKEWVHKLWDFDKPYRHVGRELGTGTQIGMSIGLPWLTRAASSWSISSPTAI